MLCSTPLLPHLLNNFPSSHSPIPVTSLSASYFPHPTVILILLYYHPNRRRAYELFGGFTVTNNTDELREIGNWRDSDSGYHSC